MIVLSGVVIYLVRLKRFPDNSRQKQRRLNKITACFTAQQKLPSYVRVIRAFHWLVIA